MAHHTKDADRDRVEQALPVDRLSLAEPVAYHTKDDAGAEQAMPDDRLRLAEPVSHYTQDAQADGVEQALPDERLSLSEADVLFLLADAAAAVSSREAAAAPCPNPGSRVHHPLYNWVEAWRPLP